MTWNSIYLFMDNYLKEKAREKLHKFEKNITLASKHIHIGTCSFPCLQRNISTSNKRNSKI